MSLPVIIRPLAELDLREAQVWYDQKQPGLGARFRSAVDSALERISYSPKMFPATYKGVRRASVQRFPYMLYFAVQTERVLLLACFHARRGPDALQGRLRSVR